MIRKFLRDFRVLTLAGVFCSVALCSAAEPDPGTYVLLPNERPHLDFNAAYRAGRADATRDVARGYFAAEEFGRTASVAWQGDYAKIAEQRFGIHVKTVAGCIVDEQIVGHAKGYNEISEPAIKRKFGRDVLVDARVAASTKWERNRHR